MKSYNLTPNNIHLWYIPLNIEDCLEKMLFVLSTDEVHKANKFHFAHLRNHYIIRRSALRYILSQYCNIEPQAIKFSYTDHLKLYLDDNPYNLQFNMSNSNQMAVFAVTQRNLIGIDIECLKPIDDMVKLVQQYFSKTEYQKFLSVPAGQQLSIFYNIWTRKEAFVKAIGEGISYPLNIFDVAFLPSEPIKLLKINNSTIEANKWSLDGFSFDYLDNTYTVAIFTKSPPKKIISFHYINEFANTSTHN